MQGNEYEVMDSGLLNNPKRSKEYNCISCKMQAGRNINAARNILIKNISMNILDNEMK